MKRAILTVCLLAIVLCCCDTSEARRWRRRGRSSVPTGSHMTYTPTEESTAKKYHNGTMSLQDIAMARAKAMADTNNMSHSIHHYVKGCPSFHGLGVSEGIGVSTVKDYKRCSTCITGRRVVADGYAFSKSGRVYRCRFFRN